MIDFHDFFLNGKHVSSRSETNLKYLSVCVCVCVSVCLCVCVWPCPGKKLLSHTSTYVCVPLQNLQHAFSISLHYLGLVKLCLSMLIRSCPIDQKKFGTPTAAVCAISLKRASSLLSFSVLNNQTLISKNVWNALNPRKIIQSSWNFIWIVISRIPTYSSKMEKKKSK